MDILGLVVILVLIASVIYTLYKENYRSTITILIMLAVYLLIKYGIGVR